MNDNIFLIKTFEFKSFSGDLPETQPISDTSQTLEEEILSAATSLYERGFNIFPVEYGSKTSHLHWDLLNTSRLPKQILKNIFNKNNVAVLVGKTSMNLCVIDCDSKDAFDEMYEKLSIWDLDRWVVSTSRGGHFWFLSEDGEINSCKYSNHVEFWGNKHYVLVPPSLNKESGVFYNWENQEGDLPPSLSEEIIHEIFPELKIHQKLKYVMPNIAHEVLVNKKYNIKKYSSNSEAENAAVWALLRYGWDKDSIIELFNHYSPPHYEDRKCSKKWLEEYMIEPARKELKKRGYFRNPFIYKICNAIDWAKSIAWTGNFTASDRLVFLACCKRAMIETPNDFRATEREISELINITPKTVNKSLHRLRNQNIIQFLKQTCYGNHYSICNRILEYPNKTTDVINLNGVLSFDFRYNDVWHPKALGKTALEVFEVLNFCDNGKSEEELIKIIGKNKQTIKLALYKLANQNIIHNSNGIWQIINKDIDFLNAIASIFGILGIREKRHKQNEHEREYQAYYQLYA